LVQNGIASLSVTASKARDVMESLGPTASLHAADW
jgi:hypothetical protein